jgi:hypothetical protein
VKFTRHETIAAAAPQKNKLFFLESVKALGRARNDREMPP